MGYAFNKFDTMTPERRNMLLRSNTVKKKGNVLILPEELLMENSSVPDLEEQENEDSDFNSEFEGWLDDIEQTPKSNLTKDKKI